jgi:hypothetical protein
MDDRYLYLDASRQHRRGPLDGDTAALLAALAGLAQRQVGERDDEAFAADVLSTLLTHPRLDGIGRVCLAQLAPGSTVVWVVGAANRAGHGRNLVGDGYHCFIADDSSLLRLEEGWTRAYPDVRGVLASFAAAGMPPQRTLRLVAAMGMGAGLCLPLRSGDARGFLFLNSLRADDPAWQDPALAPAFAFLAQIARARLVPAIPEDVPAPEPARPYDGARFADRVHRLFQDAWGCRPLRIAAEHGPVLVCDGTALLAVRWAVEAIAQEPMELAVEVLPDGNRHLRILVTAPGQPGPTFPARRAALAARLRPWRVLVDATDGTQLRLSIPADPDWHRHPGPGGEVCYSI